MASVLVWRRTERSVCEFGGLNDLSLNSDLQPPCRYQNTPYKELSVAAAEQMKITEIRLRQVVGEPASTSAAAESAERRTGQMRGHLGESHQQVLE